MSTIANIQLTVTPEADAFINEVSKRKAYERLLEHIPVHYKGVRSIEVSLQPDYDCGDDPRVIIDVMRDDPGFADGADSDWIRWIVENIATEDYIDFCVMSQRV